MSAPCPVPGRWELDELARELAERELVEARGALYRVVRATGDAGWDVLGRYIAALEARNALRDGRR